MKTVFKTLGLDVIPKSGRTIMFDDEIILADMDDGHNEMSLVDTANIKEVVFKASMSINLFCRQGYIRIRHDMKEYELHKNELMAIYPGAICEYMGRSDDCNLILIGIDNPRLIKEPSGNISTIPRWYLMHYPIIHLSDRDANEFCTLYYLMRAKIEDAAYSFKREILYCYLEAMYINLCNIMKPHVTDYQESLQDRNKQIYDSFMQELHRSEGTIRDIAYFADKLCITPKYFSRLIFKYSGRFAKDWIKDFVILHAKAMLDSGHYTVQQVSDNLKFTSQSFFGRYFKESVGCSPKAYMERNLHKRSDSER
ncbi:MAG: helix-turn-helix transcriptional regulator [Muribaculaceae bacterium]|nr:helix-turn-helix transcriptional regulator [Muribaculaceae bacterium]